MRLALVLSAIACGPTWSDPNPLACDARALDPGEVRARRLLCTDERIGDGRIGDWMVENARARWAIRDGYAPLTRTTGAGGTAVDATWAGGSDLLRELSPLVDGAPLEALTLSPWTGTEEAGLRGDGQTVDGAEVSLLVRLGADSPALRWEGADGLLLAPQAGSVRVGTVVEQGDDPADLRLVGARGLVSDQGGWIRWDDADTVVLGDRETVAEALWPDGPWVSGTGSGDWVEALDADGAILARLPVLDGRWEGRVPPETADLRATQEGCDPGQAAPHDDHRARTPGPCATLRVRVVDDAGHDLPATLWWDDQPWPLPSGGGEIAPGTGTARVWVSAGPAWQAADLGALSLSGDQTLDVVLPVVADGLAARLGLTAWPDPTERRTPEEVLAAAAAAGDRYAVLCADDEVATVAYDGHTRSWLQARGGVRTTWSGTALISWPWTGDIRAPAHGAPPGDRLDAAALLSYLRLGGSRLVLVPPAWVDAAGAPSTWEAPPHGLILDGMDALDRYLALLDQRVPLAATGPLTWLLDVDGEADVDLDAAITGGRTVASNAPWLDLRVLGQGPGASLDPSAGVVARVTVRAPAYVPLSGAALLTGGGVELARWTLDGDATVRLDEARWVQPDRYLLLVAWGEASHPPLLDAPAWAVTSPIWFGRP